MKFTSKSIEEHKDVPLADQGQLEEILDLFDNSGSNSATSIGTASHQPNKSYVVSINSKDSQLNKQAKLDEIVGLVQAQGDEIVGHHILSFDRIAAKTFVGSGALLNIARIAREKGASLLVLDVQLSPSQMRNIEHLTNFSVSDRESVILNIFVKHARSRQSRIQVEIAQLKYLRPRIRGIGLNMDQQSGGIMGGRGAGETASELLARNLDKRLVQLQKLATKLSNISLNQRKQRSQCKRISLVGYTNAGKTSLMNSLAKSDLSAKNQVFETLDSTTRRISSRATGDILLSDTVGFIRELPKHLMESFESTLAEISEADLLVIVLDSSHPEMEMQLNTTLDILQKLGTESAEKVFVFNKIDRLASDFDDSIFQILAQEHEYVSLSAHNHSAVAALKQTLLERVSENLITTNLFLKYSEQYQIKQLYGKCEILDRQCDDQGTHFHVKGDEGFLRRFKLEINKEGLCNQTH
jgi:GTP-binding protein HflX